MAERPLALRLKVRRREWLGTTKLGPLILNRYPYAFSPRQLQRMTEAIDETAGLDGAMLEVGCNQAACTVYFKNHLADLGLTRHYYCLDTFAGFTPQDIAVERSRGKTWSYDDFDYNSQRLFEMTLRANGVDANTTVFTADAATFDYSSLPPIAFALLDLDLYRPMKAALWGAWARLVPGGVAVVDDCDPAVDKWDGAAAAYFEFCEQTRVEPDVALDKIGILRKPG